MGVVMWKGETPDASSLDGRGDVEGEAPDASSLDKATGNQERLKWEIIFLQGRPHR